jgi:hypothetical protein
MGSPPHLTIDFPQNANTITLIFLAMLVVAPLYFGALIAYGLNATTLNVGYAPAQPVPFSHAMHAGKLGISCQYCHNTVDYAPFAAIPPAQTCMNCHRLLFPKSTPLQPIRESYFTGKTIPWIKIHDLPDYVYFNHSAHVTAGVGCVECHGQVNHMDQVAQVQPLNMAWCLACHRNPGPHLEPLSEVLNLDWKAPPHRADLGRTLYSMYQIRPPVDCVGCHR